MVVGGEGGDGGVCKDEMEAKVEKDDEERGGQMCGEGEMDAGRGR